MSDRTSADAVAPVDPTNAAVAAPDIERDATPAEPTQVRLWSETRVREFLSVPQHAALAALAEGKSVQESADAARVHRNTVGHWLHHDPAFRAAYNAWRRDAVDSARNKLLALADAAANTVVKAVVNGDARVALTVLKDLGLTRQDAAPKTTHPGVVREQTLNAQAHRDRRLRHLERARNLDNDAVKRLTRRLAEAPAPPSSNE